MRRLPSTESGRDDVSNRPTITPTDPCLGAVGGLNAAWHPLALGVAAHAIACHLVAASEPLSVARLARAGGHTAPTVRRAVDVLASHGLAVRTRRGVRAAEALLDSAQLAQELDAIAHQSGAAEAAEAHRGARADRTAARRAVIEAMRSERLGGAA